MGHEGPCDGKRWGVRGLVMERDRDEGPRDGERRGVRGRAAPRVGRVGKEELRG